MDNVNNEIKIYSLAEILDRALEFYKKENLEKISDREIARRIGTNNMRIIRFRNGDAYPSWDEARKIATEARLPVGVVFLSVAHAKSDSEADQAAWRQILSLCEGRIMDIM